MGDAGGLQEGTGDSIVEPAGLKQYCCLAPAPTHDAHSATVALASIADEDADEKPLSSLRVSLNAERNREAFRVKG